MDTVIGIVMSYQFSILHLLSAGIILFIVGFIRGRSKVRQMARTIYELERSILQVNEELLFGKKETPIIEINHSSSKNLKATK
jgi:hypothetical protein